MANSLKNIRMNIHKFNCLYLGIKIKWVKGDSGIERKELSETKKTEAPIHYVSRRKSNRFFSKITKWNDNLLKLQTNTASANTYIWAISIKIVGLPEIKKNNNYYFNI